MIKTIKNPHYQKMKYEKFQKTCWPYCKIPLQKIVDRSVVTSETYF